MSLCIALAAGALLEVLPAQAVTLGWVHTVERTAWEEDYLASDRGLIVSEARIESTGAGMEPPSFAVWSAGRWRYRPSLPAFESVTLANSSYAPGYRICWRSQCHALASLVPKGVPVTITTAECGAGSKIGRRNRGALGAVH